MEHKKDSISEMLKVIFILAYMYIWIIAAGYIKRTIGEVSTSTIFIISLGIVFLGIWGIKILKKKYGYGIVEKQNDNKYENMCLLFCSIILLGVQLTIVWNAVFRTAWDPGAVWYGAHYVSIGDRIGIESMAYYFSVYPNNLLLVFIYSVILKINIFLGQPISNGTMLLAFFQCLLITLTGMIFFKMTKKIVGKRFAWWGYWFYFILVGLSGWIMIPYSDSTGIIFPILILYIYTIIKENDNSRWKYVGIFSLTFLGYVGFQIKPMVVIVLIAVVIIEGFNLINQYIAFRKINLKEYIRCLFSGIVGLVLAYLIIGMAFKAMNFPVVTENVLGWQHHMMLGLNKDTNGGYSQEDFDYSTSFATSEEQHAAEYAKIKQRLEDLGFLGYMEHFVKKSARNYFDASFGWGGIGDSFYTEIFLERDNKLCPIIRSLYYDNNDENLYKYNLLLRQTMWYIVICLMPFAAWTRGKLDHKNKVLLLSVLGLMMYLQIFEAHARYVFTFVPLYIIVACLGMRNLVHKTENE